MAPGGTMTDIVTVYSQYFIYYVKQHYKLTYAINHVSNGIVLGFCVILVVSVFPEKPNEKTGLS